MKKQDAELRQQEMLEKPVERLIVRMGLPTMASMLLSSLYNLVDTYFVSQINTSASAAAGVAFPLLVLIQAVSLALAIGGGSYAARCLGAGQKEEADRTVSTAFFLSIFVGSAIGIVILLNISQILSVLGATQTILPYASGYAFWVIMATPFYSATFVLTTVLRQEGSPELAMFGSIFGALLNTALDPIFIFALHGGVNGAAMATSLSQIVTFCILMSFVLRGKTITHIAWKNFSLERKILVELVRIGLPEFFRQALACAASILLNVAASAYGDSALAAISISNRLIQIVFNVLMGFGQGFMPVCGYNFGAGRKKRVLRSYAFAVGTVIVAMTICMVVFLTAAEPLMRIFRAEDAEVVAIGSRLLHIQGVLMPMAAFVIISNMLFQACGEGGKATVISISRQGILFVPLILLLPRLWGLTGVLVSQPGADLLTGLICLPLTFNSICKICSMYKATILQR